MTTDEPIIDYCRHCRQDQEVRIRYMGDKTIMRCMVCNNWIRCLDCLSVKAVDHNCPRKIIEVPS